MLNPTIDPVSRRSLLMLPWTAAVPRLCAQGGARVAPAGLVGDGSTLNTRALQAAIEHCASAGGGQVVVPPGRYLTGTLRLRDRVTLYLEAGAVLVGSPRLEDYPVIRDSFPSYTSNYTERCLIRADTAADVAICGAGSIDGNGTAFAGEYKVRPFLLRFIRCRGVQMQSITLQNSAMWVQHYLECEDVLIDGIRVRSRRKSVNNDGIDIDSSQRVRISNCDINCGDDAIVLKATTARPCRDVVVTNCILSTLCNAFKLGTESNGGFDNIVFSNSTIYDTDISGIAVMTVDGGWLGRVNISNIVMRNTASPIFLCLANRARPVAEGDPRPGIGAFSGVMIRGVDAEATGRLVCSVTGLPGHPAEEVLLEDIRISTPGGGMAFAPGRLVKEVPDAYPQSTMFGPLPAYGLYCRHVRGLSLQRVAFRTRTPDARPALVVDDVDDLAIAGFRGSVSTAGAPLMDFRNVGHARIRETQTGVAGQPLLRLSGGESNDIAIAANQEREPLVVAAPDIKTAAWRWQK